MTERDFCYWLQGFIELSGPGQISERQKQIIAEHLSLVMNKVTPTSVTQEDQAEANQVDQIREQLKGATLRSRSPNHPLLIC